MGTDAESLRNHRFAILPRSQPRGGLKLSDKKADVIEAATERHVQNGQLPVPQQRLGVTDPQQGKIGNGRGKRMLLEITAKVFGIHPHRRRHIAHGNFIVEIGLDKVNDLSDRAGWQGCRFAHQSDLLTAIQHQQQIRRDGRRILLLLSVVGDDPLKQIDQNRILRLANETSLPVEDRTDQIGHRRVSRRKREQFHGDDQAIVARRRRGHVHRVDLIGIDKI